MRNITYSNLHFALVTIALGKTIFAVVKLHPSNLNNQRKYNL